MKEPYYFKDMTIRERVTYTLKLIILPILALSGVAGFGFLVSKLLGY